MSCIVLGANTPVGAFFLRNTTEFDLQTWGRSIHSGLDVTHVMLDLTNVNTERMLPLQGVLVSFAPIWHLASFLRQIVLQKPDLLKDLVGIVACSSSSFVTKRFAFNRADKELSRTLTHSQNLLMSLCKEFNIPCQIIAPTLVYGSCAGYQDKNLNSIRNWMRILPFILIPKNSGLRQPIHASQLAMVARHIAKMMCINNWHQEQPSILALGGDVTLTYENMIRKLIDGLDQRDPARRCRIILIPVWVQYALLMPILPIRPRACEALLRMFSDLSGFMRACDIVDMPPLPFPVKSLSNESSCYE